jgi:hypothetical protein
MMEKALSRGATLEYARKDSDRYVCGVVEGVKPKQRMCLFYMQINKIMSGAANKASCHSSTSSSCL